MRITSVNLALALVFWLPASASHAVTLIVNSSADPATATHANCSAGNASTCTLRDAIVAAVGGDTILFAPSVTNIAINTPLTLGSIGNANPITIDGKGAVTIDGRSTTSLWHTLLGTQTVMQGLTLQNGYAPIAAGAIANEGTLALTDSIVSRNTSKSFGGAISNSGSLTVTRSTLSENGVLAAANTASGGAIYNSGRLAMIDSALSKNSATFEANGYVGFGGAIYNVGLTTLVNSTANGNIAANYGGAIYNGGATLVLTNSTLSENAASGSGAEGGGIANFGLGTVEVLNSTLANNYATFAGAGISTSGGIVRLTNSLVADGCAGPLTDAGGNLDVGTSCGFSSVQSKSNARLDLGPLQNNGGSTQTLFPGERSAAIDFTDCGNGPVPPTDQRGVARPQGSKCDSGAVEVAQFALSLTVTGPGTVFPAIPPVPFSGPSSPCSTSCTFFYPGEGLGTPVPVTLIGAGVPDGYVVVLGGVGCTEDVLPFIVMSDNRNCTVSIIPKAAIPVAPVPVTLLERWAQWLLACLLVAVGGLLRRGQIRRDARQTAQH